MQRAAHAGRPRPSQVRAPLRAEMPSRPLHVLFVHGMGTPAPYAFEAFIRSLADRFGLVQIPAVRRRTAAAGMLSDRAGAGGSDPYGTVANRDRRRARGAPGSALYLCLCPNPERFAYAYGQLSPLDATDRIDQNAVWPRRITKRRQNRPSPPSQRTSSTTSSATPCSMPGLIARPRCVHPFRPGSAS